MKNFIRNPRIFLSLLFSFCFGVLQSQVIWTEPAFPNQFDDITVYFDATKGNGALAGFTGDVYAHTGVITNQSTSGTDWKYVIGNWGTADTRTLMTRVSDSIYTIQYNINDYYNIPPGEEVLKLAFVFRNVNGSIVGRDSDGADIFTDVYPPDQKLLMTLLSPAQSGSIVLENDSLLIDLRLNDTAFLQIRDDGLLIFDSVVSSLTFYHQPIGAGFHQLDFEATTDTTIYLTITYLVIENNQVRKDPPAGLVNGLNYYSDTSYVFQLFAPLKNHVFLLCPSNSFDVNPDYQLTMSTDSSTWWIELSRELFTEGKNCYQYLVDGTLKIADPFSEVVLDPANDAFIRDEVMAELPSYPTGMAQGIITAFDPEKNQFSFAVENFIKPEKNQLVIYELLVRDFLADHSFASLKDTLGYLERLGINAIELMPIQEFEGNQSWGYNPSFHMAVDKYYGSRTELKAFIDAAHEKGIAVILDVVYNHAFSQSPLAQLYWDAAGFHPSPESPYLNVTARHPFNVGYDFNHESEATKSWVKQTLSYWITEFKVDGFRFDLSKGFTQLNSGNNADLMAQYDPGRIAILKDYADHIWSLDSSSYVILEHFANNDEEIELSDYGAMLWGNMNHQFIEAGKGLRSDLEGVDYTFRNWNRPHLIGYMESHDEERQIYRILREGDQEAGYNTRNLNTALQRMAATSTIFYLVPGPKMLWQFGEIGYEFPINRCVDGTVNNNCRLDPKPIRWDYLDDPDRDRLRQVTSALIHLKKNYPTFSTDDFVFNDANLFVKSIHLNHPEMDAVVLTNYRVINSDVIPKFPYTGTWYEYFSGDSIQVLDTEERITFLPGEYRIYSSLKVDTPDDFITSTRNVRVAEARIYPNIISENRQLVIEVPKPENIISLTVYDIAGQLVETNNELGIDRISVQLPNMLAAGIYLVQLSSRDTLYIGKFIKQ